MASTKDFSSDQQLAHDFFGQSRRGPCLRLRLPLSAFVTHILPSLAAKALLPPALNKPSLRH
eukprot:6181869-Pleurochrysis_carterae.AAC.2